MIQILQSPLFKRQKKKLKSRQIQTIDEEIKKIIDCLQLGIEKKWDLNGIFIYNFRFEKDLLLLAYTWDKTKRNLLMLGTHENFYSELKKYI